MYLQTPPGKSSSKKMPNLSRAKMFLCIHLFISRLSSKTKKFPNIKRFKNELILHILLPFKTKTTEQSSPPCWCSQHQYFATMLWGNNLFKRKWDLDCWLTFSDMDGNHNVQSWLQTAIICNKWLIKHTFGSFKWFHFSR